MSIDRPVIKHDKCCPDGRHVIVLSRAAATMPGQWPVDWSVLGST